MVSSINPAVSFRLSLLLGYEFRNPRPDYCDPHPSQFHVDKLSSAHIYLRLREGETWDNIPQELLTDLAQLTKANSIEGRNTSATAFEPPADGLRQQEGQHHHHLHPLVQPQEGR